MTMVRYQALGGAFGCALGALLLAGCQDVKEMVGLTPDAPNEFEVVRKRPLSMPPDFHLLPPEAHTVNRADEQPRDLAKQALLGVKPVAAGEEGENGEADNKVAPSPVAPAAAESPMMNAVRTQGEAGLLSKVGPAPEPNIRAVIEAEHAENGDGTLGEKIFTWQKEDRLKKHEIDPHAEKAALEGLVSPQSQAMADAAAMAASDAPTATAPQPTIVPKSVAGWGEPVSVPMPVAGA